MTMNDKIEKEKAKARSLDMKIAAVQARIESLQEDVEDCIKRIAEKEIILHELRLQKFDDESEEEVNDRGSFADQNCDWFGGIEADGR